MPFHVAIASLSFALLTPLQGAPPDGDAHCDTVDPRIVEARVAATLATTDERDSSDELDLLQVYWESRCTRDRRAAQALIVEALARLLERRSSRMGAASMLLDVGANLRHARHSLRRALTDVTGRDRFVREASGGLLTNYALVSTSLRCVLRKIRTGMRDPDLCRFIDRSGA